MKPYLITTGIAFAIIFLLHTLEIFARGRFQPEDILVLGVSAGLGGWAWRLMRAGAR